MKIRSSQPDDLGAALRLLKQAGLPVADVSPERLFLIAESNIGALGVIGREVFPQIALLRSLVVAEAARGKGVGAALVAELEARCIADSVHELWLLTIDAERFFSALGYNVQQRSAAPAAIRATAEFSSLCPGDAVLMSKQLAAAIP